MKHTEGGWMWYVNSYLSNKPADYVVDYKHLMQCYLSGTKWEDV